MKEIIIVCRGKTYSGKEYSLRAFHRVDNDGVAVCRFINKLTALPYAYSVSFNLVFIFKHNFQELPPLS
jgi:hypothetical protein